MPVIHCLEEEHQHTIATDRIPQPYDNATKPSKARNSNNSFPISFTPFSGQTSLTVHHSSLPLLFPFTISNTCHSHILGNWNPKDEVMKQCVCVCVCVWWALGWVIAWDYHDNHAPVVLVLTIALKRAIFQNRLFSTPVHQNRAQAPLPFP